VEVEESHGSSKNRVKTQKVGWKMEIRMNLKMRDTA
jgi:hypothetical protein